MMRRRGGRGIVGTMATTAVVAGTAGAVHHRQEQRYQNKAMDQQQQSDAEQAAYDSQAQIAQLQNQVNSMQTQAPPAAGGQSDLMQELQQLASMQAAGILTPEQFETAKNKLLAS